ncbi:MAG TPA: DUF1254 domain-containing protein [Hyphomicrobiaceae bacterium]|nr:DUF1254 domain-containing protein [Hyphomicrobiaceae bacterium]
MLQAKAGTWVMACALSCVLALGTAAAQAPSPTGAQAVPLSEQEAHEIAVNAYLYLYPLVTMDLTRRQMTNIPAGKEPGFGPPNTFHNVAAYPSADVKVVVRPNFDTLYSIAWLDLGKEPAVVSVPDTKGRYYLLPMLDMWTNVFASPGWRTTGTHAQHFLVAPAGWRPDLRERFVEEFRLPKDTLRIDAPTSDVWIIGRTKTDGPQDYDAVHEIQAGLKVTPLSEWGRTPKAVEARTDPSVDMKTPPKIQVEAMAGDQFFTYAAELLKINRPHLTDQPIIAQMKKLGIEPGKAFDIDKVSAQVKKSIEDAPSTALNLMAWKLPTLARVANHWSMNTNTMGVYGNYYLKRAIVAQQGLGANLPEDAIYPLNLADKEGRPLDGANKYVLHFEKADLPPVKAFWSVTLYDQAGYQVANPLSRFAVSSWMPFKYEPDGSLTLYIQNDSPGADKEANWLPAPKEPFNLTMRLYAPRSAALTGKWNPPPVTKTEAFMGIMGQ